MAAYDVNILEHYKTVAEESKLDASSTMQDLQVRALETELIVNFVGEEIHKRKKAGRQEEDLIVGDIGCGNGYTLSVLKEHFDVKLVGFEYSPEMRQLAQSRFTDGSITISPVDIRDAKSMEGVTLDIAICQRVFINLLNRNDQAMALDNIAKILDKESVILTIEAYESSLNQLNEARAEFKLDPIPPANHNLYLKDDFFIKNSSFKLYEPDNYFIPDNFLSTHYYMSRILYPAIRGNQEFKRNSLFATFMTTLFAKNVGDFSPVKAFAFTKIN